jgi:type I restriction enzyme S subunit
MTGWPLVPLGDVLTQRKEFIQISDSLKYKRCRVQLHAQGIVLRDEVPGIEIKTKAQQVCREDEFLVAEIDAKVGGFGIVPSGLEGAIVSSHYFLFAADPSVLDVRFLDYYIKTAAFRDQVTAQGSTNYAAIRPSHVLAYIMPLPSLEEQRRIVERILVFAKKHAQILQLRRESEFGLDALCRSILFSDRDTEPVRMADLVSWRQPDTTVERHDSYSFAGVYCFGKGVFRGQTKSGTEFAYDRLTRIRKGEFTYPKLMAWEGALGVVPEDCDGLFVSPEYPVFSIDTGRVLPEVLDVYYRTPSVWPILAGASTGTNVRRRRLNPTAFLNLRMPVPPMSVQQQIRKGRFAFETVARIRRESESEVNALLGSVLNQAFSGLI